MHRHLPRVASPYRVVFTPQAWREIGLMPTARFEAFQHAVDDLAVKCGRLNVPATGHPELLRFSVEGLVVTYERDDAGRTLKLVDLLRAPESP
jgi:hypothetical protein